MPTAALIVRRDALPISPFDEGMRYGEDVDLIWRLVTAGWRVRYDASVEVAHLEPGPLRKRLVRQFHYGTSAGPLARRHPGKLAHLTLAPGPTAAVAALAAGRPGLSALAMAAAAAQIRRRTRRAGLPAGATLGLTAESLWRTWIGIGRWAQQFGLPAAAALATRPTGHGRRRRLRRMAVAALIVTPALVDAGWPSRRTSAWSLTARACEQAAYGLGVVTGCARTRSAEPVLPAVAGRDHLRRRPRRSGDEPRGS